MENKKNHKLLKQIMKFAVVGGLAFVIDFTVYTIVVKTLHGDKSYLIAGICGFTVSLIFNYLASMAFVFERKDDADKKKEFVIFLVLSLIGMGLNTLLLWLYVDALTGNIAFIYNIHEAIYNWLVSINVAFFKSVGEFIEICAKVFATAIVMVYNFISRKMTLEKKDEK
ncbi:MAG: GtrA family protein [Lachnospiraceae bacterium]|nr:GtrA family protein [Lachnospiraceae bacterium]